MTLQPFGGMHPQSLRRCVVMAPFLICAAAISWSDDLKGTIDADCCDYTFHLPLLRTQKKKASPKKEITLRLHRGCPPYTPLGAWVGRDWVEVDAKVCKVGSSQCDPATAAKIRLESVTHKDKHASGSYSVDFANEHHAGQFRVKSSHKAPKNVCL